MHRAPYQPKTQASTARGLETSPHAKETHFRDQKATFYTTLGGKAPFSHPKETHFWDQKLMFKTDLGECPGHGSKSRTQ